MTNYTNKPIRKYRTRTIKLIIPMQHSPRAAILKGSGIRQEQYISLPDKCIFIYIVHIYKEAYTI